jgi:hypothetical protein
MEKVERKEDQKGVLSVYTIIDDGCDEWFIWNPS